MMNPRARDAGARDCLLCKLDGPTYKPERRALQPSPSAAYIDELLVRLSDRLHFGRLDGWLLEFGKSVIAQARRGGPRWKPSPKQLAIMEEIVERRAEPAEDETLIEEAGDDPTF